MSLVGVLEQEFMTSGSLQLFCRNELRVHVHIIQGRSSGKHVDSRRFLFMMGCRQACDPSQSRTLQGARLYGTAQPYMQPMILRLIFQLPKTPHRHSKARPQLWTRIRSLSTSWLQRLHSNHRVQDLGACFGIKRSVPQQVCIYRESCVWNARKPSWRTMWVLGTFLAQHCRSMVAWGCAEA